MTDDDHARSELANLLFADMAVSGARTPNDLKAALMESVRSLRSPLKIEMDEPTEEDRRARRSPTIRVTLPRLPGEE